jgi:adenylyltransferase/sulfurtransferase
MTLLTVPEKQRYRRHLLLREIGEEGQQKIKDTGVLVVGAGGLGCPVIQYLTAAGIGRLGIMDDGQIDMPNLQRQVFYSFNDIGKQKAIVSSLKMRKMNPLAEILMYNRRLSADNAVQMVCKFDVIVDCTDNQASRYVINDACILAGKPMVHGAIHKYQGQLSVFNYEGGPSYRCLHPENLVEEADTTPGEEGIFSIIPGIIGLMQASEVIKIITRAGTPLSGKLMVYNAFENQLRYFDITRNPDNFDPEIIQARFPQPRKK